MKKRISEACNSSSDVILDLGCGSSPKYQRKIKGKIVCFDMSEYSSADVIGDGNSIPFRKESFDKIVSVNSLYYLKNPFKTAEDLKRILKKKGKVVAVVPFFYPIHDVPADKYRFTRHGIENVFKDFKIEKIEPIGGIFNVPAIILHSIIKGVPLLFAGTLKSIMKAAMLLLFPFYLLAQIFSLLDVFDKTGRFPTYYFFVASKK